MINQVEWISEKQSLGCDSGSGDLLQRSNRRAWGRQGMEEERAEQDVVSQLSFSLIWRKGVWNKMPSTQGPALFLLTQHSWIEGSPRESGSCSCPRPALQRSDGFEPLAASAHRGQERGALAGCEAGCRTTGISHCAQPLRPVLAPACPLCTVVPRSSSR